MLVATILPGHGAATVHSTDGHRIKIGNRIKGRHADEMGVVSFGPFTTTVIKPRPLTATDELHMRMLYGRTRDMERLD
jgi:hypothetical protein